MELPGRMKYFCFSISCGRTVFRQLVGIPMGTDCAQLFANLFYTAMKDVLIDTLLSANAGSFRSYYFIYAMCLKDTVPG